MAQPATRYTKQTVHCSNCGDEHPTVVDSYTECCNEPACGGEYRTEFATIDNATTVVGCCFGVLPNDRDWQQTGRWF